MNQQALRRHVLPVALALCLGCTNAGTIAEKAPASAEPRRPHIVLVMADDMGYSDIGCYGSEIATPTLDALATSGVRMTQLYNTSRCCPTRAALLTGLYSHQAGIGLMTGDRGHDAYRGALNGRCVTIAEGLGDAGYRTYMSGKWHVTGATRPNGPKDTWPIARGFDRFYGTIIGAGSFYDPATLCRDETFITPINDPEYQPEHFYYTDAISDNAVRYAREHLASTEDPMFLYVSYTSAHWPMHAPEEAIARYDGVYDDGYEPVRAARLAKARALGVLEENWAMSPAPAPWSSNPNQAWDIRSMQVYAAMIESMDAGIGRIVDELREAGELDNTLFVYLQDNGGCAEDYGRRSNADKRPAKPLAPMGPDDLQKKIWPPMQTRGGAWVGTGPGVMAGPEDSFIAYGTGWANVSNTPFRGFKHDALEGGISTPFIVHWPQGLAASRRGAIVQDPAHLIDVLPTFLEAAAASYPEHRDGVAIQPAEGVSLLPALSGDGLQRDQPLGFEHHGNQALRDGRWKIVSTYQKEGERRWELYDMESDRTELHDLAARHPGRVNSMVKAWRAWADHVGVVDWPIPPRVPR